MDPERICEANCELFGKHAANFESTVVPLWQEIYDSLVARAGVTSGLRTLDVGTGPGEVAVRLATLVGPNGSVVGTDVAPEMLEIARSKAMGRGLTNVTFRQMPAEELDLPSDSFDAVLGNYSICCCYDYGQALREVLRVLKPGGRLTYNHSGPDDPPALVTASELFEDYKTKSPSKKLQEIREANAAQDEAVAEYLEPKMAKSLLKKLGYRGVSSETVPRVIRYSGPGDFIDRILTINWASEADEVPKDKLQEFRGEAVEALRSFSSGPTFTVTDQMTFYTGRKATGD